MNKKWIYVLVFLLISSISTAYAMTPADILSFSSFNIFKEGKLTGKEALEVNGKIYIPMDVLEDSNLTIQVDETFHRVDIDIKQNETPVYPYSTYNPQNTNNQHSTPTYDYQLYNNYEEYHAGMIETDLKNILRMLNNLEDISKDFSTIVYSHLRNIQNGMSIDHAERRLKQIENNYEQLEDRYEDMIDEIDELISRNRDFRELEKDFTDDMEDIFDDMDKALSNLKQWIDDKDDDDFDDYKDYNEDAIYQIKDVRDYVEGTLEAVKEEFDDMIKDTLDD